MIDKRTKLRDEIMSHLPLVEKNERWQQAPLVEQDGGGEIHPLLEGIKFRFWKSRKQRACFVDFVGKPSKPLDWVNELSEFVATMGISEAKQYLRKKARFFANKEGFQYDPDIHGLRWL